MKEELFLANYKADGEPGKGISFAIVGDHDNRPTDMTNLVIYELLRSRNGSGNTQAERRQE